MDHTEILQKNIRGISITRAKERAFHCVVSIDTHTEAKDTKTEALGLMYVQALLSGCKGKTREEFLTAVNLLGATINVNMDRGILSISLTSIDTHAKKILDIMKAMLLTPAFVPLEIQRIKEQLKNELHEEKEDAKTQSVYAFVDALYGRNDRRYMSNTDSVRTAVSKLTASDLQRFHAHAMSQEWIFTLACDEVLKDQTMRALQKMRASFVSTSIEKPAQELAPLYSPHVELISIPSKQNIELNMGGLLPLSITSREYHAFVFGLNVLGKWGGFAGRLMSTVREKEGLTYGIYARVETAGLDEYGYWRVMTFFAPDKVIQGIESTRTQIELIKTKGVTQDEYDRFKTILNTGHTLLQDSIVRTAGEIHSHQVKGLTHAEILEHRKKRADVSLSEVNDALVKYLDLSKLVIAGAGPIKTKEKELQALCNLVK